MCMVNIRKQRKYDSPERKIDKHWQTTENKDKTKTTHTKHQKQMDNKDPTKKPG